MPDPSDNALNAPSESFAAPFSRTWKVTFRRWGRAWLAFLALGLLAAAILSAAYPSPVYGYNGGSMPYYVGVFIGLALIYLCLVGWWLDHILAQAGFKVSLVVQALVAAFFGLAGNTGDTGSRDPAIGFPLIYASLACVAAVALAHFIGGKVEGSFKPSDESAYSPSGM